MLTPMPLSSHTSSTPELSDETLERYILGRTQDQAELAQVENHLTACAACSGRAEAITGSIATVIRDLCRFEAEG